MAQYTLETCKHPSGSYTMKRTDHSEEIAALRARVRHEMSVTPPATATLQQALVIQSLEAAAALLEVHDAGGLSLDDWVGPREMVETALAVVGFVPEFLRNEV